MYYIVSKTSLIMSPIKVEVSLLDNAPITILAPYWKRMAMKCPKQTVVVFCEMEAYLTPKYVCHDHIGQFCLSAVLAY